MKNFFKTFFLISLLVGVSLFVGQGPVLGEEKNKYLIAIPEKPELNKELSKIDLEQFSYQLDNEKYKFIPEQQIDIYKITTHEYKTEKGEIGYQTIIDDGDTIISTATGVEQNERTYTFKKNETLKYVLENK